MIYVALVETWDYYRVFEFKWAYSKLSDAIKKIENEVWTKFIEIREEWECIKTIDV